MNDQNELMHVGTPHEGTTPHSGRFEWGSGKQPFQRATDFTSRVAKLKYQGLSEPEIAKQLGFRATTDLRYELIRAQTAIRQDDVSQARRYLEEGYSISEIGRKMGRNESSIRSLLNKHTEERKNQARVTAEFLKEQVDQKGFIDVGKGIETELGISRDKLDEALWILEKEYGYPNYTRGNAQVTNPGQQTNTKYLCPAGTEYKDVYAPDATFNTITDYRSNNDGESFEKKTFHYPESLDSKRLMINYADTGTGKDKDGVIEIRPGVKDLDLGEGVHYAQVRIMVDGTHYLKGMAVYANDLPEGIDVRFNTNKNSDVPALGPKNNTVLKVIKNDPDNPFGSLIKEEGGQSFYDDQNGKYEDPVTGKKQSLSLINKREEEGGWGAWADRLPSQFLSKQPLYLIDRQLNLAYAGKKAEYEEIMSLNNPTVKKSLLESFASGCDSDAEGLYAAALPRQKYQVILPLRNIKDTECFAPNYDDGETVALVRFPHGGTFEIPILKVNNKNKEGIETITKSAKDAIGINANVAERLSGADFDGDTVLVIPCSSSTSNPTVKSNAIKIMSTPPLKGLEGFDAKLEYKIPLDDTTTKRMTSSETQKQMGIVSNLITDMTMKGASESELARAVRHSMVVIDAEKHELDYKRSFEENRISELQKNYQGIINPITGEHKGGASTLISLAGADVRLPIVRRGSGRTDPETGKVKYKETVEKYIDKNGKEQTRMTKSTMMNEVDDARVLSSGYPKDERYALYANQLKSLANQARKDILSAGSIEKKPSMAKMYAAEVADLDSQLNEAKKNAPRERMAQVLARSDVEAKKVANPGMQKSEIKKASQIAIKKRRAEVGAHHVSIEISDRQWEAIQTGAISENKLREILNHTDIDKLRQRATPRTTTQLSSVKQAQIKAMAASGYSNKEIADKLGISSTTVGKYL